MVLPSGAIIDLEAEMMGATKLLSPQTALADGS
jgi:hypothetical protein